MDILHIVLIVLAAVGIWVAIELGITLRKTRENLNDITRQANEVASNANETIEQVQPIITKVDGMMSDLEPAVQKVDPLVEKTNTAIDVATVDLATLNDILVDVSAVTDTASNVTSTVSKATNSAVSGVAGVVGKFTGGSKSKDAHRHRILKHASEEGENVEPAQQGDAEAYEEQHKETREQSYFTYGKNADSE